MKRLMKFNESVEEKWTDERIKKIFQDHVNFCGLIQKYLEYKLDDDSIILTDVWWGDDDNEYLNVTYNFSESVHGSEHMSFTEKEYKTNILEFINNPELHKDSNKFGI